MAMSDEEKAKLEQQAKQFGADVSTGVRGWWQARTPTTKAVIIAVVIGVAVGVWVGLKLAIKV